MADQLQEMLQRIYEEGVNKAKAEAQQILEQAKKQAQQMKAEAETEADKIITQAKQKASELEKNILSDLKMASTQAITALKNKMVEAIISEIINKPISQSMNNTAFLQKMIMEILTKWSPESSAVLTIPEKMKPEIESFFQNEVKKAFDNRFTVEFKPQMKNGITIAPADGSYKLSFTDEDFMNFFKAYLRPRAAQLLFGE